jgi:hypothetical protein
MCVFVCVCVCVCVFVYVCVCVCVYACRLLFKVDHKNRDPLKLAQELSASGMQVFHGLFRSLVGLLQQHTNRSPYFW